MVEVDIYFPDNLSVLDLRTLILDKLKESGEPLRWSITNVITSDYDNSVRQLRVESILLVS
tara:strand:+ start:493 stop:675 length:183 start_codon:yes stop_codon:yes gene_type:complete